MRIGPSREPGRRNRGFTLVEMLLVLVILAALAAVVVPKFAGRSKQARVTAAETEISTLETALDAFEVDNGFYPPGSLDPLVEQPSDAPDWRGPYIRKGVPRDPWDNPYIYTYPGKRNPSGYDLSSAGPDGKAGSEDDIVNWAENR